MLAEIREQPEVLRRVAREAGEPLAAFAREARGARRWHLAGCGDMHFAAACAAWAGTDQGLDVRAWPAMDVRYVARRLTGDDVVVCASVSGRTPRTVEAARLARSAGARVLALSDNAGSPITREAHAAVVLGTSPPASLGAAPYAGYEHHVPQTKTYTAALLAELLLVRAAAGARGELDAAGAVERSLAALDEAVRGVAGRVFPRRRRVAVLGSGPHGPAAAYGAAKLTELALPALARCVEEFNHLEAFVTGEEWLVVALAPDDPSAGRVAELVGPWRGLGAEVLVVGAAPSGCDVALPLPAEEPTLRPFQLAAALQLLAFYAARPLGRDPDRWAGGERTGLIDAFSLEAVRGSEILGAPPSGQRDRTSS